MATYPDTTELDGSAYMLKYMVWCETRGQAEADAREISTRNPWSAAREWADHDDATGGGYAVAKGEEITVCVKDASGSVTRWLVFGELVPLYSARCVG